MTVTGHGGIPLAVDHRSGTAEGSILFAHATGFCKELWDPVYRHLDSRRSFVGFDTRGHGDSGDPGPPYDWWDCARDLLEVIAATASLPWFGVGHSAGAAAIVLSELLAPGTFEALVLIEPIIFPGPAQRIEGHPLTQGALRRRPAFRTRREAHDNFASKPAFSRWVPEALVAYVEGGLQAGSDGWELKCAPQAEADFYRGALAHGAWERLEDVSIPVVVIAGEDSDTHVPDFLAAMVDRFPVARGVIVPEASHFVPMEQPAVVASLIDEVVGR